MSNFQRNVWLIPCDSFKGQSHILYCLYCFKNFTFFAHFSWFVIVLPLLVIMRDKMMQIFNSFVKKCNSIILKCSQGLLQFKIIPDIHVSRNVRMPKIFCSYLSQSISKKQHWQAQCIITQYQHFAFIPSARFHSLIHSNCTDDFFHLKRLISC